jgi:hypothetical protein
MSSLTSGLLSKSLLELLELSESNRPGLISIPDMSSLTADILSL